MKLKIFIVVLIFSVTLACNKKEKKEASSEVDTALIAQGKQLFSERTCASCHTLDNNDVGPSIREIVATYNEQNKDIMSFLKGEQEHPIVDKDSSQVAVMKTNIDEFIKGLSDDELKAISAYMMDAAK